MLKPNHMQDPEFEKIVRQKMEELNFNPPEALWKNVALGIQDKKRSRRPLFWPIFLLGLGLAGGFYFGNRGTVNQQSPTGKNEVREVLPKTNPEKINKNVSKLSTSNNVFNSASPSIRSQKPKIGAMPTAWQTSLHKIPQIQSFDEKNNPDPLENQASSNSSLNHQNNIVSPDISYKKSLPPLALLSISQSRIYPRLASSLNDTKTFPKQRKKTPWTFGLTISPGISRIEEGLFKSGSVSDMSGIMLPSYNATPGGAVFFPPSTIQSDAAYSAGVIFQKPLSNRIALSIGVNYHYYSTLIKTGAKVGDTSYTYSFNSSPPSSFPVPSLNLVSTNVVYQTGNTSSYINRYHFIELPVSVQILLNQNNHLPISWEVGMRLSRMIASNALHYDYLTDYYFKDNALFNKTQVSASTALLVGFWRQGHFFQAGPELQYGLTNMITDNAYNKQHLIFYGIKLTTMIGKFSF